MEQPQDLFWDIFNFTINLLNAKNGKINTYFVFDKV